MQRHTGCSLEMLRYRFHLSVATEKSEPLSAWECRDQFLRGDVILRECKAGMRAKRVGRGKAASLIPIWPDENPTHSWALGILGVAGNFTLAAPQKQIPENRPLSATEIKLDAECAGWRALLRDALARDYADWGLLEKTHQAEWVRALLMPLPLTIETREGAPIARVVCQSLLDVLIVTSQLDGIRGFRQRVCKAEGCGELFAVGNYEHKIYCDYQCAHRQAVKDGRRRKREALEKAAQPSKTAARRKKGQ
jgi:hypothetical protein